MLIIVVFKILVNAIMLVTLKQHSSSAY